jgi:FKBP-type peptidyl-prolyl cis-trans isomerase
MADMQIESGIEGVPAIQVEIVTSGNGQKPLAGDTVNMHYVGTFPDGGEFDSSRSRGQPFQFKLGAGMVIKGWDLLGAAMCVGDRWVATIPYQLAYGEGGHPAGIPPKQDLVFDMEMLDIL